MTLEIILNDYLLPTKKERKLNRFSVSELYYLINGWTSIEDYVKGKEWTVAEAWKVKLGTLKHQYLEEHLKTLGYQIEQKKEFLYGEIELVGVADALKDKEYGIEIKTSDKLKTQSSRSHDYQARLYCSLFEVPIFYIMQPIITGNKAILKEIGKVKKNDSWFSKEVERINDFYKLNLKNYEVSKR